MTFKRIFSFLSLLCVLASFSACRRTSNDVWEDTKSGSRHISRGVKSFGGKCGDSRAVCRSSEFLGPDEDNRINGWPVEEQPIQVMQNKRATVSDFIPLADQPASQEIAMAEFVSRQPAECPGDPGSSLPGIDSFRDPATMPGLAQIFKSIQFDYNSYLVKGVQNTETLHKIADYMRQNPGAYLFVEGHTDERGPEAYNLSLGSRRANAVRNELIQIGANSDNLFTISYGKERPLVMESHDEAWSQNRRAEFKIYKK